ncbi:hypothetical protein FN846DRAFT_699418 [Sphaerosporella brunnea]|uniref:Uncharacterized protein n=1 Tax=Sphaerosporella brunnea TaxID=1250544 RepID=A0A5J5EXX7_9PEZI|nr:hypothetical protein FN846DRAFT_699418 [Sphaerosporella brunnea]
MSLMSTCVLHVKVFFFFFFFFSFLLFSSRAPSLQQRESCTFPSRIGTRRILVIHISFFPHEYHHPPPPPPARQYPSSVKPPVRQKCALLAWSVTAFRNDIRILYVQAAFSALSAGRIFRVETSYTPPPPFPPVAFSVGARRSVIVRQA